MEKQGAWQGPRDGQRGWQLSRDSLTQPPLSTPQGRSTEGPSMNDEGASVVTAQPGDHVPDPGHYGSGVQREQT